MKRESKTKRELRKELSKFSKDDLELIVDVRFFFNDEYSSLKRRKYWQRKEMAAEILKSNYEVG